MSPRRHPRRKPAPKTSINEPKKPLVRRMISSRPAAWALCGAIGIAHAYAVAEAPYQENTFLIAFPALVAAPGILTMLLLAGQWRRWYRWAAITGLAFLTLGNPFVPLFVAVGTVWALHRAWFTERTGALIVWRGKPKPKAAPAPKSA